jgi:hypothetical protein
MEFPFGAFGENLTTEGLLEGDVHIGDRFRAGTCELIVAQPRMPCFKLGIRFNRPDMVKRFLRSGRTGFYFAFTRTTRRIRICCAGQPRCPRFPTVGVNIFMSAFGRRTDDSKLLPILTGADS